MCGNSKCKSPGAEAWLAWSRRSVWLETYKYRGVQLEMKVGEAEAGQSTRGPVGHGGEFVMSLV